jgi:cyclophilin family peptidyl-prolyl cis-trans isomerase
MKLCLLLVFLIGMAMAEAAQAANPVVLMETSKGTIKIELFEDKAPESVKNFLAYAEGGHYDGTVFHRVISGFMVQGGGFDEKLEQKPTKAPIRNEAGNGLSNDRGTLAMARTNDPDSATAQFFINHADNKFLNRSGGNAGYAVFGRVVEGMDVVDAIARVKTGAKGRFDKDVPQETVVIKSVKKAK